MAEQHFHSADFDTEYGAKKHYVELTTFLVLAAMHPFDDFFFFPQVSSLWSGASETVLVFDAEHVFTVGPWIHGLLAANFSLATSFILIPDYPAVFFGPTTITYMPCSERTGT